MTTGRVGAAAGGKENSKWLATWLYLRMFSYDVAEYPYTKARGYAYAKIEYVSVRTYLSENRIRTLRILEPCHTPPAGHHQITGGVYHRVGHRSNFLNPIQFICLIAGIGFKNNHLVTHTRAYMHQQQCFTAPAFQVQT